MNVFERAFFRRPRLLDVAHRLGLASPTSQTTSSERGALARYAKGAANAVEIGTYQGVSAVCIALALAPAGRLWCIDPWPENGGRPNPCWSICKRHFDRAGLWDRISVLRGCTVDVGERIPALLDFAFIDGDHSWKGIEIDWNLVSSRIRPGGHVCLHDSVVPPGEPWRSALDSNRYFEQVIRADRRFELVETVHSLVVLRRT